MLTCITYLCPAHLRLNLWLRRIDRVNVSHFPMPNSQLISVSHISVKGFQYITVTSQWARWHLKSPASRLFIQPFIQSSRSLAFVRGIHRWPVNSPHKWQVTRKMVPFDEVIMIYGRRVVLSQLQPDNRAKDPTWKITYISNRYGYSGMRMME